MKEVFFFPMLKDLLKELNKMKFGKICKELHWEFIPTI